MGCIQYHAYNNGCLLQGFTPVIQVLIPSSAHFACCFCSSDGACMIVAPTWRCIDICTLSSKTSTRIQRRIKCGVWRNHGKCGSTFDTGGPTKLSKLGRKNGLATEVFVLTTQILSVQTPCSDFKQWPCGLCISASFLMIPLSTHSIQQCCISNSMLKAPVSRKTASHIMKQTPKSGATSCYL